MKKIYSKSEPDKLILSLMRYDDISEYRTDICPNEERLQISGRKLKKGLKVKAHKHISIENVIRLTTKTDITQEAWVVFEGCIKGTFYDLDDSVLYETKIGKGDVIVLFRGGHSLEVLDEDTIFYEFKTGPYNGTKSDKEDINE
tara:strand:- start:5827 stop:6258 length:432 start_codon:yes stop_codon:yes gene_type:complete